MPNVEECCFRNLVDVLQTRARDDADQIAVSWGGSDYSNHELLEASLRFAHVLQQRGVCAGQRVVVVLPNSFDYLRCFFAVQLIGATAVPLFPGSGRQRVLDVVRHCDAFAIVLPEQLPRQLDGLQANEDRLLIRPSDSNEGPTSCDVQINLPEDLALIQYTSGSTGNPKGVQISHQNILSNLEHLIAGMKLSSKDVFLSWLPMHHDMGLILMTLAPLFLGARLVLLPTNMASIRSWMLNISRFGGTVTAGPDFAYRLCIRTAKGPDPGSLSCLRLAVNAAEPVRSQTIHDFERRFGLEHVMVASYGLAEATVGVSTWPPGTSVMIDERGLVSVGRAFPGVEVRIIDGEKVLDPGLKGEIVVRSAATTRAYLNNPDATKALKWRDGFVRTGELGYQDVDGNLFIVGRLKDMIIHGGHSLANQEVEETVDQLPFVRRSAAVGIDRGRLEGEQVHVCVELRQSETVGDHREQARQIVCTFYDRLGFRPGRVLLMRPQSIPMTSNGKIQYSKLREGLMNGRLRSAGSILFPDY